MADVIRRMRAGHKTSDIDDTIDEIASAKGTYTTLSDRLSSIDSEQESQETTLDENRAALVEIVDSGAKNSIYYTEIGTNTAHGTSYTVNGVTFIINSDGTVTATRIESSDSDSTCNLRTASGNIVVDDLCDGHHVLSGCPSGGSSTSYSIVVTRGTYRMKDYGNGIVLDNTSEKDVIVILSVRKAFSGTITFKPMICTKVAWDISQQYVPYRPSYDELIARIEALEGGV